MAEASTKKRKSVDEHHGRTKNKKVAIEEPSSLPDTISVSSVVRPQFSPPVIATTPGLVLSASTRFRPYAKRDDAPSKKRKHEPEGGLSKELMLHSTSHRSLDYTAREDKSQGGSSVLRHYIGLFDPATGSLQIVEAKKMIVRGVVRTRVAADEAMAERTVRENVADMKNELGQAFGTKKAKKAIQAMAENALAPSRGKDGQPAQLNDGDVALMDSIKGATSAMATREELQAAVDQARPVPRGNFEAAQVEDVYVPREMIGAEVLNAIPVRDWQEKARRQEAVEVPSRFVAHRLNRVAAGPHSAERLRALRYLLFLIAFWASTSPGKGRGSRRIPRREKLREVLSPAPEVVVESIRRRFSDGGEVRKIHADLLATHCCALACVVDGFDVDTFDLREDLRLEPKQMNQYFAEIGARVRQVKKGDRVEYYAKLALPLQFPRLQQQRQRQR